MTACAPEHTSETRPIIAVIFELLVRSAVSDFSIGPVTIKDPTFVREFIPAVVAYLLYDNLISTFRWNEIDMVYEHMMARFHPKVLENDLHLLVRPRPPALWALGVASTPGMGSKFGRFYERVSSTLLYTLLALVLAFEGYAYYKLLQLDGFNFVLLVSIFLTLLFVALGVATVYLGGGARRITEFRLIGDASGVWEDVGHDDIRSPPSPARRRPTT